MIRVNPSLFNLVTFWASSGIVALIWYNQDYSVDKITAYNLLESISILSGTYRFM